MKKRSSHQVHIKQLRAKIRAMASTIEAAESRNRSLLCAVDQMHAGFGRAKNTIADANARIMLLESALSAAEFEIKNTQCGGS